MDATEDRRCQDIIDRVAAESHGVPTWLALRGVLGTLGEVLPFGTAAYLAANLPAAIGVAVGRHFPADGPVGPVTRGEFTAAVARRCGCPAHSVEPVIRAVTRAVAASVPLGVLVDVQHMLPEPLLDLVPPGST
jgi:uncharacterized protein (DUF2267 family)